MKMQASRAVCWLFAVALTRVFAAQVVPPSPGELISRANAAHKAQLDRGRKYTYREDHEEAQVDKSGKPGPLSTKTYDHIMLEGSEYRKLILIDGKPLDAKTQKKVDEDVEKARAERRKHGILNFHRSVSLGPLELLNQLFDNRVTGEETINGRKTWRMESEPKPGYKPADKQEEEALASRRVNWFDQEDGFQVREDSFFIRAANGFQPETTLSMEYARIGDDWLPGIFTMHADMKWMPGVHGRADVRQHYYDYKRFTVDSTLTTQ